MIKRLIMFALLVIIVVRFAVYTESTALRPTIGCPSLTVTPELEHCYTTTPKENQRMCILKTLKRWIPDHCYQQDYGYMRMLIN